jgi:hypothetical protein
MKNRNNILITLSAIIALLGGAAGGLPSLRGATITVTETGDGFGVHTNLRQALVDANDGDTIEFDPLLGGRNLPVAPILGQFVVDKSVTISWVPQVGYLSYLGVDGMNANRVFYISPGKTVTISGLTIINGSAPPPDYYRRGGGIYNDHATLTLKSCTISGNAADQGVGGGIYTDQGTLTVSNCTISGNSSLYGAGIATNLLAQASATVTIANCTISGNSATAGGGGIFNDQFTTAMIINSTLSGNAADWGGGIANGSATVTIANCTISGNSATGVGGGITNDGTLTMTNSTLSGNSATAGGGGIFTEGGTVNIGNTILNAGASGENIYIYNQSGTVSSLGYNLSSDDGGGYLTATGDQINTDPRLGPLQDNGGPIFTHLPASDSPAINGGDPTLGMDQRGAGFPRVVSGRIDIGAVEAQATPKPHGKH